LIFDAATQSFPLYFGTQSSAYSRPTVALPTIVLDIVIAAILAFSHEAYDSNSWKAPLLLSPNKKVCHKLLARPNSNRLLYVLNFHVAPAFPSQIIPNRRIDSSMSGRTSSGHGFTRFSGECRFGAERISSPFCSFT